MHRRRVVGFIGAATFSVALTALAQRGKKAPVIGVLVTETASNISLPILVQGLGELGYHDGENIVITVKSAQGQPALLGDRAAELARMKVDVIYATGPAAVGAAASATSTIPIVALDLESDPVQAGWAQTLSRPGGNVTGLFLDVPGLAPKWLEVMKEAVPSARRAVIVWDPSTGVAQRDAALAAAPRFNLDLRVVALRSAAELDATLDAALKTGAHATIFMSSPLVSLASARLAEFTLEHRLAALSPFRRFAEAGGLISYGPDFDAFRMRSAIFVDKILKGATAANLPIEQPTKFELLVNLKTASALRITMPQSLLVRADQVIQ